MKHESSLKPYPEYRDSGISWIGMVPSHWNPIKLNSVANFLGGGTPSRENPHFWNGPIPWVSPKDMKSELVSSAEETITHLGLQASSGCLIKSKSVLLVVRSGILKHTIPVAVTAVPLSINQDLKAISFKPDVCSSFYFARWVQGLNKALLLEWTKQGATVESLEHEYLSKTIVPLPPIEEQNLIVEFLSAETAKIDLLIQKQERLIELLQEKRQAVISHAVTKGLDPTVSMKDSGVEWMGRIPQHWRLVPLGAVTNSFRTGPFGSQLHSEEYVEDCTPVINPSNIKDNVIYPDWSNTVPGEVVERLSQHVLSQGELIIGRRGDLGRCAVVTPQEDGWLCGTGSIRVLLKRECNPAYVSVLFLTNGIRGRLLLSSVGSTMDNLNTSILSALRIPMPPIAEQVQILHFLSDQLAKLDALLAKASQSIELMKERRSALISAAVTGKIDVREAA